MEIHITWICKNNGARGAKWMIICFWSCSTIVCWKARHELWQKSTESHVQYPWLNFDFNNKTLYSNHPRSFLRAELHVYTTSYTILTLFGRIVLHVFRKCVLLSSVMLSPNYDVIKWRRFPHYCPFVVTGGFVSPLNHPLKGLWLRTFGAFLHCCRAE